MNPREHIPDAIDRVEHEIEHVDGKLTAFDRFERTVRDLGPTKPGQSFAAHSGGAVAVTSTLDPPTDDRCRQIRDRFVETVHSYSRDDTDGTDPTAATMRKELGEHIALALTSGSGGRVPPELHGAILSASENRRSELRVLSATLERERANLEELSDELERMCRDSREFGSRRLHRYGFEALRKRHEQLEADRDRCRRLAHRRQELFESTTSRDGVAGLPHRSLIAYLYQGFTVDHPVLADLVRFDRDAADKQRALRDQLSRRI